MSEYEYKYTEQSVDVRTWNITAPIKLTEQEVQDLVLGSDIHDEGGIKKDKETNITVEYEGVEYGDDCQTEIEGDTKED